MKVINLHHHSEYSIKKALTTIDEIVDKVSLNEEKYHQVICISDFTNAGSWAKIDKLSEKKGYKPLFSLEFNVEDGSKINHISGIAKNEDGIKNLIWLHNHAWENFFYVPRVKREWLKEHSNGIIWLTGDIKSELSNLLLMGEKDKAKELLSYYKSIFQDVYIEIIINDFRTYAFVNKLLMELSRETGVPYVITNDGRYISEEHSEAYKVWLLSGEQYTMEERNRSSDYTLDCNKLYYYSYDDYYNVAKENGYFGMVFQNDDEFNVGIENQKVISDMCNARLDTSVKLPKTENAKDKLKKKVLDGFAQKGLGDKHIEQIKKEFDVISKIGAEDYFLILNDIAEYCNENKIQRGDRGSCAASLVSYCLDITSFDPTDHKLLMFDRFLSEDRVNPVWKDGKLYMSDPPDVDLDFQPEKREMVKEYIKKKYG